MGCSAGVIAVDLAREMLELYPNSYALVVSHENITNAFYAGNNMCVKVCVTRVSCVSVAVALLDGCAFVSQQPPRCLSCLLETAVANHPTKLLLLLLQARTPPCC
jgi:hypothetical protein